MQKLWACAAFQIYRGPVTASGLDEMFGTPGADNNDGFAVFVVSGMLHIECLKLAARRIISSN